MPTSATKATKTKTKGVRQTITKAGPKSKTKNAACSEAMSIWKTTGRQDEKVRAVLAECRKRAGTIRTGYGDRSTRVNMGSKETRASTAGARAEALKELGIKAPVGSAKAKRTSEELNRKKDSDAKPRTSLEKEGLEEMAKASADVIAKHGKQEFKIGHDRKHSKNMNKTTVGKAERAAADAAEIHIGKLLGGVRLKGTEAKDVIYKTQGKDGKTHYIEVKTKLTGEKQELKVHNGSLHRKRVRSKQDNVEFHTIVIDLRDVHRGGEFKQFYSGHRYYYERGLVQTMALSKFEKVNNPSKELHKLIAKPEHELKLSAQNGFLKMTDEQMKVSAIKGKHNDDYNKERQEEIKIELAVIGKNRHGKDITPVPRPVKKES